MVSMESQNLAQVRAAQLLSDYKLTPATLLARLNEEYIASRWVLYLSYRIAQCVAKGKRGLLISAPPRHGKSWLATIATPLWVLENFPQYYTGVITYGEELSTDFTREIKDYIQNNPNLLSVRIRPDISRVANFLTTAGGGLRAVGLNGTITGRGFNVLVIDDYIKNAKEAMSANYLEGLWNWYRTVARTRLEPGAVIIIVATRWVKNDLHGKLLKLQELSGGTFWEHVEMPALALENDVLGRAPGEPLFPERYTVQDILDIKAETGARWFEAMFQQNPQGDEGSVINIDDLKRLEQEEYQLLLRQIRAEPARFVIGRYWDFASTRNAGDYTAGVREIFDRQTETVTIDDVVRGQFGPAKAEHMFAVTSRVDLERFPGIKIGMEEEPGSSGKYAVRHFQKILDDVNASTKIQKFSASNGAGKLLNAQPFLAHVEQFKVQYVANGHWVQDFLDELESFPEVAHDDQTDAAAGAYKLIRGMLGGSITWGRGAEVEQLRRSIRASGLNKIPRDMAPSVGLTWGRTPT